MFSDSGSEAEDVAMVVPVEVFSANDVAAKVLERLGASLTSLTEITNSEVVEFVPSDAITLKV